MRSAVHSCEALVPVALCVGLHRQPPTGLCQGSVCKPNRGEPRTKHWGLHPLQRSHGRFPSFSTICNICTSTIYCSKLCITVPLYVNLWKSHRGDPSTRHPKSCAAARFSFQGKELALGDLWSLVGFSFGGATRIEAGAKKGSPHGG